MPKTREKARFLVVLVPVEVASVGHPPEPIASTTFLWARDAYIKRAGSPAMAINDGVQ